MKTITDDPEGFFESGGWTFLDPESEDEKVEEEETEDEDEAYQPTDAEDEVSEYSEEDSEYSEGDTEDDDDASEELGKWRIYVFIVCCVTLFIVCQGMLNLALIIIVKLVYLFLLFICDVFIYR